VAKTHHLNTQHISLSSTEHRVQLPTNLHHNQCVR